MLISSYLAAKTKAGVLAHEHAQGGPFGFRGMLHRSPAPHLLPPEYPGQFHGYIRHHRPVLVEVSMKVE